MLVCRKVITALIPPPTHPSRSDWARGSQLLRVATGQENLALDKEAGLKQVRASC